MTVRACYHLRMPDRNEGEKAACSGKKAHSLVETTPKNHSRQTSLVYRGVWNEVASAYGGELESTNAPATLSWGQYATIDVTSSATRSMLQGRLLISRPICPRYLPPPRQVNTCRLSMPLSPPSIVRVQIQDGISKYVVEPNLSSPTIMRPRCISGLKTQRFRGGRTSPDIVMSS